MVLWLRVNMAQHFLLSPAARSLSAAKIMRMSDNGVENVFLFLRLRWPDTDGKSVCPGCGCTICYACPRSTTGLRWRCKACRGDFSITSGTLFAWHKLPLSYARLFTDENGVSPLPGRGSTTVQSFPNELGRRGCEAQGVGERATGTSAGQRDPAQGVGVFCPGGARPPTQALIAFIDDHRGEHGVEPICAVLPIAPSTYHIHAARRADPAQRDASLSRVFEENLRKVWREGQRVDRLMQSMGLQGAIRGKPIKTTNRDKAAPCPLDTSTASSRRRGRMRSGCPISPTSRLGRGSSTSAPGGSSAGVCHGRRMQASCSMHSSRLSMIGTRCVGADSRRSSRRTSGDAASYAGSGTSAAAASTTSQAYCSTIHEAASSSLTNARTGSAAGSGPRPGSLSDHRG